MEHETTSADGENCAFCDHALIKRKATEQDARNWRHYYKDLETAKWRGFARKYRQEIAERKQKEGECHD